MSPVDTYLWNNRLATFRINFLIYLCHLQGIVQKSVVFQILPEQKITFFRLFLHLCEQKYYKIGFSTLKFPAFFYSKYRMGLF